MLEWRRLFIFLHTESPHIITYDVCVVRSLYTITQLPVNFVLCS